MSLLEKKNKVANLIKMNDKSITFYKPKNSLNQSSVWECFNIIVLNNIQQELVCCVKCNQLLVYRQRHGTSSLVKHKRSCEKVNHCSNSNLFHQQVTKYYSLSNLLRIPKIIKEKVKIGREEFAALASRPIEVISGDGWLSYNGSANF